MIYSLILAIANAKMQEMELPPYTDNLPHLNLGDPFFPIKTQSSVTGGHDSCLLLKLTAQSQDFLIRVDTGSSDTALPAKNLNSYIGPAITYSAPSGQALVSSSYGDSSSWSGYQTRLTVGVFEVVAPIARIQVPAKKIIDETQ